MACLTTSAFILWLLGFPDTALGRANDAVAMAGQLQHPCSLAYALFHSGFLHLWRREPDLARDRAVGVLRVADEHDFQIWRAVGTCLLGAGNAGTGQFEPGLAQIRRGMDLYQGLRTPPVFWPLMLFMQAGAHAAAGQKAEGLTLVDEALQVAVPTRGCRSCRNSMCSKETCSWLPRCGLR